MNSKSKHSDVTDDPRGMKEEGEGPGLLAEAGSKNLSVGQPQPCFWLDSVVFSRLAFNSICS